MTRTATRGVADEEEDVVLVVDVGDVVVDVDVVVAGGVVVDVPVNVVVELVDAMHVLYNGSLNLGSLFHESTVAQSGL